jgi:hypothetical protein
MTKSVSDDIYEEIDGRLYVCVETNEEGIEDFKRTAAGKNPGVILGQMRVEGKMVPAFKMEITDRSEYLAYKREQWKQESQWKMENRCEICGSDGKLMRCPLRKKNPDYKGMPGEKKTVAVNCENCPYGYDRLFKPVKGRLLFSTLDTEDDKGNVEAFEPEAGRFSKAEDYIRLLGDFIAYIRDKYPKYVKYIELIELLGQEIEMKEAAQKMGRADSTMYDWVKRLRPIYEEFKNTVDYL